MTKFLSKDGKFYMRDGKLLRPTNILEVPVTSNLTYNGNAQSPAIYGYDENTMTMSGVTSGTDAGTYHITFTPKSGYEWSDGTSDTKNVNWTIEKATIATVPSQSNTLTYTSRDQSPSWSNYSSASLTIGGTTSATNAGSYTATFTPKTNYKWFDGTSAAKNVMWNIGKAAWNLSVDGNNSALFNIYSDESFTQLRISKSSYGQTVLGSALNPEIATIEISGYNITITKSGTGTANFLIYSDEDDNHFKATVQFSVRCGESTPLAWKLNDSIRCSTTETCPGGTSSSKQTINSYNCTPYFVGGFSVNGTSSKKLYVSGSFSRSFNYSSSRYTCFTTTQMSLYYLTTTGFIDKIGSGSSQNSYYSSSVYYPSGFQNVDMSVSQEIELQFTSTPRGDLKTWLKENAQPIT